MSILHFDSVLVIYLAKIIQKSKVTYSRHFNFSYNLSIFVTFLSLYCEPIEEKGNLL